MCILTVALTGGIATGKSVVARILKKHGCYIHSADRAARDLMKPRLPAWKKIVAYFGPGILKPDQTIDRAKLGAIIFSRKRERQFLNRLIHPLVMGKKVEIVRRLERKRSHKIFVSEAALTVESGFARFFDKVIVVDCRKETQIRRLMARDKITRSDALKKIRSQMPFEKKLGYADYVIDTSGTLDETARQTEAVYRNLLSDYKKKSKRA
jgi:dephospho-CoA kinase